MRWYHVVAVCLLLQVGCSGEGDDDESPPGSQTPAVTPTATPTPGTPTPSATPTPGETSTPAVTDTPGTGTPIETATPGDTSTPAVTDTPGETSTPTGTATPGPTETPGETSTPTGPTPTPGPSDADGDGFTVAEGDCDDDDDSIYPGAEEVPYDSVDQDCADGDLVDVDEDGYPGVELDTGEAVDCEDEDETVYPGAAEICNEVDDDCDDSIDDGVKNTYYQDSDGDGFGGSTTLQACTQPSGYVATSTDCDDANKNINPSATETCNGVDDDCDAKTDDADSPVTGQTTWYKDADADTYGDKNTTTQACSQPSGYSSNNTDCNDAVKTIYPGASEACNGVDDDCDGQIDDNVVNTTYYKDGDGDGYGNKSDSKVACSPPTGYVTDSTDCNDANKNVNPGATETCNSIDDDCDSQIDEGVKTTYYQDNDHDNYGNPSVSTLACTAPTGYVTDKTDCNDANAAVHPNATETCNAVDDDCDSQIDEGVKTTYYQDSDKDGFGNSAVSTQACTQPSGYVTNATDCNDANVAVYPGATEVCNGIDDDCDTSKDEGLPTATYYQDADGDSYGSKTVSSTACSQPSGYVTNNTDCNDANKNVYPGAAETCNNVDDDCDTTVDDGAATSCPGDDTECQTRVCATGGSCSFSYTAKNTPTSSQTTGDCKENQCDGAGNIVSVNKNTDVKVDNKQCTSDLCTDGTASNPPVATGTSCSEDSGNACDANGACVPTFYALRIGDGVGLLSSSSTAVFVEERLIDGTLRPKSVANPLPLPTAASGNNQPLTLGGTATSEGGMTRSVDGKYLVVPGYGVAPGTASPGGAASSTVNRVVGRVDANGAIDTTTRMNAAFSTGSVRGAASSDGSGFWVSGTGSTGVGGIQYVALGSTGTSTQVLANPNNARFVNVFANQLYGTSGSGTFVNVFSVGSGTPTSTGQTATSLPGMPTASGPSPYAFVFFDLKSDPAGVDTLYVADDRSGTSGGIQKWTLSSGTWTLGPTINSSFTNGTRGLTGYVKDGTVTLIATTGDASANKVVVVTDDGINAPVVKTVATAPTNTVYRGVALSPK